MVSRNSKTNCIVFPLHLLIIQSISKLYQSLELTNKKKVSYLSVVLIIHFQNAAMKNPQKEYEVK
jgi:hypothetical protein